MKKILIAAAILFMLANVVVFSVKAYEESSRILETEINPDDVHPRFLDEAGEIACYQEWKPCEEVER
jgi:uncharacterized membrane protein